MVTNGTLDSVDLGGAITGIVGTYTITFNAVGYEPSDTASDTAELTINDPIIPNGTLGTLEMTATTLTLPYEMTEVGDAGANFILKQDTTLIDKTLVDTLGNDTYEVAELTPDTTYTLTIEDENGGAVLYSQEVTTSATAKKKAKKTKAKK